MASVISHTLPPGPHTSAAPHPATPHLEETRRGDVQPSVKEARRRPRRLPFKQRCKQAWAHEKQPAQHLQGGGEIERWDGHGGLRREVAGHTDEVAAQS